MDVIEAETDAVDVDVEALRCEIRRLRAELETLSQVARSSQVALYAAYAETQDRDRLLSALRAVVAHADAVASRPHDVEAARWGLKRVVDVATEALRQEEVARGARA